MEIVNEIIEDTTNDNSMNKETTDGGKKAKGNVVSNREYRARKGEEINRKRREKRMAERAVITPTPEYERGKILKGVDKLPEKRVNEGKKEVTKNTYISFIRQFYKRRSGEELEEDDEIIKSIREEEYNALKVSRKFKGLIEENYEDIRSIPYEVNNLYKIFKGIRGFTEISKKLYAYVLEYAKQYEEKRSVAKVDNLEDLEISFKVEDVNKNIGRIVNKIDKIIYGYIFLIKGRLNELRMTMIARDKEETRKLENNYIYENRLYINNTKNGKHRIMEIPEEFMRLCSGIEEGYLLGELLPQSTLSQRLQRITQRIYGRTYTYLNIRHINATQINGRGASLREREDSSNSAGHSVVQQLRYVYKVEEV
jgi:hypothetical protein